MSSAISVRGKADHDGDGPRTRDAGHGDRKEGVVVLVAPHDRGVVGGVAAEEHLIADHRDDEPARDTHGAVRDPEEGEEHVPAEQAHEHDGGGVNARPEGLLSAPVLGHPLRKTHKERELREGIRDDDEGDERSEKILEVKRFNHDEASG